MRYGDSKNRGKLEGRLSNLEGNTLNYKLISMVGAIFYIFIYFESHHFASKIYR